MGSKGSTEPRDDWLLSLRKWFQQKRRRKDASAGSSRPAVLCDRELPARWKVIDQTICN
jgi:hypothetical protein